MTLAFRTWALVALTYLPLLAATVSCNKKEETVAPTAATGTVEGTISPAGAVTNVTATNPGGLTFLAAPNAASGAFSLPNLAPGPYILTFSVGAGYFAPASRSITVTAGQTASAGTVQVASDGSIRSGTMTWMTDGVAYSTTQVSGGIDTFNHSFSFSGETTTGSLREVLSAFQAQQFYGVGTVALGGSGYQGASLARTNGGIPTALFRAGPGTLTVASYNAAAGTISGTFGFVGTDNVGPTIRTVTVTNGTFSFRF